MKNEEKMSIHFEKMLKALIKKRGQKYQGLPGCGVNMIRVALTGNMDCYLSFAPDYEQAKKEILDLMDKSDPEIYQAEQEIFTECCRAAEIRRDFDSSLAKVDQGHELSYPLGYGFFKEDLEHLVMLHKEGKHREKIEDLLEDCNFHEECSQLIDGNYAELL